jgi:predicted porin
MKYKKIISFIATSIILLSPTSHASELFDWYGSIRAQVQDTNKGELEYKDNYSRLGAAGSAEILDGIKASYNVEFRLFSSDGSFAGSDTRARLANIGLESEYGSLLIGKQYSPQWNYTNNAIDIFADVDQSAGCTNESSGVICHTSRYGLFGYDEAGNGHYVEVLRPDRAVTYTTPDLNGFQASAMAILNDGDVKSNAAGTDSESLVGYNIAAKYTWQDLTFSAARFAVDSFVEEASIDSVQVVYNHENLSVAAHYQISEDLRFYDGLPAAGEMVNEKVYEIYVGYKFTDVQVQAAYSIVDMTSKSNVNVDTDHFLIDVIYPHKYGKFYAEYSMWGDEAEALFIAADTVLVGVQFDF